MALVDTRLVDVGIKPAATATASTANEEAVIHVTPTTRSFVEEVIRAFTPLKVTGALNLVFGKDRLYHFKNGCTGSMEWVV